MQPPSQPPSSPTESVSLSSVSQDAPETPPSSPSSTSHSSNDLWAQVEDLSGLIDGRDLGTWVLTYNVPLIFENAINSIWKLFHRYSFLVHVLNFVSWSVAEFHVWLTAKSVSANCRLHPIYASTLKQHELCIPSTKLQRSAEKLDLKLRRRAMHGDFVQFLFSSRHFGTDSIHS